MGQVHGQGQRHPVALEHQGRGAQGFRYFVSLSLGHHGSSVPVPSLVRFGEELHVNCGEPVAHVFHHGPGPALGRIQHRVALETAPSRGLGIASSSVATLPGLVPGHERRHGPQGRLFGGPAKVGREAGEPGLKPTPVNRVGVVLGGMNQPLQVLDLRG